MKHKIAHGFTRINTDKNKIRGLNQTDFSVVFQYLIEVCYKGLVVGEHRSDLLSRKKITFQSVCIRVHPCKSVSYFQKIPS